METKIDIDTAFKFVFLDKDWIKKILIAGALNLTMIGVVPILGWGLEIQRRVIKEEEGLLPDWHYIGIFTLDGLKYLLVNLIWTSPLMLLYFGLFFVPFFSLQFTEEIPRFFEYYTFGSFLIYPLMMLIMFLFYTLSPLITGIFVDTGSMREALRIPRVWKLIRSNFLQCLGVAFLSYLATYAASMVGMALLFVGMFFTAPIGIAIMHHFFGQAYRNALIKLSQEPSLSQT